MKRLQLETATMLHQPPRVEIYVNEYITLLVVLNEGVKNLWII